MPERRRRSQATELAQVVLESNTELFLDQHQRACVTFNDGFIVHPVRSKYTQYYISKLYWELAEGAVRSDVINAVTSTLEGVALSAGQPRHTYNRVARIGDVIYYDVGDDENVIEITANGWEIKQECPILFRRYSHQKTQVLPEEGGSLSQLDEFINIGDPVQSILFKTYIPVAFFEDIARPVLIIHGPQGAGKSSALLRLRDLIDPSSVPLPAPSHNAEDLNRLADHNYCFFMDNVSYIKGNVSDTLCRFVTGASFTKRELFTNDDDVLYSFKRLVALNGIEQVATRADLLDRSIIIELDRIDGTQRKREGELLERFNRVKPAIFGAVLDVVAGILANYQHIEIAELPRMADYYVYAMTAAEVVGYGTNTFTQAFGTNLDKQHEIALETSPVAHCIVLLMVDKTELVCSPSQLHGQISNMATNLGIEKGVPNGANWLWKTIARDQDTLKAYGIEALREKDQGLRVIRLINTGPLSQASASGEMEKLVQESKRALVQLA